MNIDLEKLLELAGKATPGNWGTDGHTGVHGESGLLADTCFAHDAAFISAANPSVVTELVSMVKGSTLDCIADVQAEPEFPGDAPPELIAHIRQCIEAKDEQHLLHMMRMAVSITKKGIQERIAARTIRTDKKRPFYPDEGLPDELDPQSYSEHGTSVFRCRKCGEPVDETVPAAKYGVVA